jgi:hypothetical protein
MDDDIVTRLRHMAWQGPEGEPWIGEMLRAADEIQRLRYHEPVFALRNLRKSMEERNDWHPCALNIVSHAADYIEWAADYIKSLELEKLRNG